MTNTHLRPSNLLSKWEWDKVPPQVFLWLPVGSLTFVGILCWHGRNEREARTRKLQCKPSHCSLRLGLPVVRFLWVSFTLVAYQLPFPERRKGLQNKYRPSTALRLKIKLTKNKSAVKLAWRAYGTSCEHKILTWLSSSSWFIKMKAGRNLPKKVVWIGPWYFCKKNLHVYWFTGKHLPMTNWCGSTSQFNEVLF